MYTALHTPTHAGAMTPAELAQRAARRAVEAAAGVLLTAAAVAYFTTIFFVF